MPARFNDGCAKSDFVEWIQLPVCRNQSSKKCAEGNVGGRKVIKRSNAHREYGLRGAHTFIREPADKIGMQSSHGQNSGTASRNANEIGRAPFVSVIKALKDR